MCPRELRLAGPVNAAGNSTKGFRIYRSLFQAWRFPIRKVAFFRRANCLIRLFQFILRWAQIAL